MSMFGANDAKADLERTMTLVESVLTGLGADPKQARIATSDGSTAWSLYRGSAQVLIFLNPSREEGQPNFLRVVSPIWRPPTENLQAIYKHLLELNARDLYGTAFGLMNTDVVLVTERPTTDMDKSEVQEILQNIGSAGDYFDDRLVQQFGGKRLYDLVSN